MKLVIVPEWWGLNDHIRSIVSRFQAEGFDAVAVDYYGGQVTTDEHTAERLAAQLDWKKAQGLIGAHAGPKVGVVGFCLGGALALASAADHPFGACVPFYGIPDRDVSTIRCPVQAHFALHDEWCTADRIAELQLQLPKAEVHRYDAQHAFFNDTREVYSPNDAKLAYERTVKFLKAALA